MSPNSSWSPSLKQPIPRRPRFQRVPLAQPLLAQRLRPSPVLKALIPLKLQMTSWYVLVNALEAMGDANLS